ncbi:Isoquinoline 1-oxidoreductase subunit [Hydrocarboniphaga sp.]|uniref:Isoquinoline 1-oxidoreductase subunit n=1 Tax=Hydrocarboniphaga sp. TaxID=2033016 RepID=UPI003D0BE33B
MDNRMFRATLGALRQALLVGLLAAGLGNAVAADKPAQTLKSPADFAGIADPTARSQALFTEAGKVIQHPRCLNCHPKGDSPTQGMDMHPHTPPVVRGQFGLGATALACYTCHQQQNFDTAGVPGNPAWHLAPIEMAWQGQTLGQICEQLKDSKRNGGRSLQQIQEHMAKDPLVGWGWKPGIDISRQPREAVPGTQAQFGALIGEWIKTGAACPAG